MIRGILSFLSILLLTPLFGQNLDSLPFKVEVIQDGNIVDPKGDSVALEKKPFQLRITLIDQEGVFMNASFGKTYFGLGKKDPVPDYEVLNMKTMATSTYNEDKKLVLHPEYVAYYAHWPEKNWHRFDKGSIKSEDDTAVGTLTFEKFWVKEKDRTIHSRDIERDIYLFFLATAGDWDGNNPPEELGRRKLKLTWKE